MNGHHSAREIFIAFTRIGLSGFGGVNFWIHRILVEEKRWMTDQEYLEGLAMGQIIPGPNAYNLAVLIGHRFGGVRGAFAAIGGLLLLPLVVILTLGILYQHFNYLPAVQRALSGMALVAAGLILANAISLALALPKRVVPWAFLGLAFVGVAVLRWPLVYVMGGLAPFAIASGWRE